jgi:pantothenate kinase-related protein Tda10
MNKSRMWVIGAVLAMVVIIAGGWFIGIAPQLAIATSAKNERSNVMAANARNQILLAKLKRDYQNIDEHIGQCARSDIEVICRERCKAIHADYARLGGDPREFVAGKSEDHSEEFRHYSSTNRGER